MAEACAYCTSPEPGDIFDRRTHPCGCRTYFDLRTWRSVTAHWCDQHAQFRTETKEAPHV